MPDLLTHPQSFEQKYLKARSLYESAFNMVEQIPIGLLWLNPTSDRVGFCNTAALAVLARIEPQLGHTAGGIVGSTLDGLCAGDLELLAGLRDPTALPCVRLLRFGQNHVEITLNAIYDRDQAFCGTVAVIADKTEELAREQQLQEQTRWLEKALSKERELTSLQRDFVSMVSHEFRTPLAIIDATAQRLLRREITTELARGAVRKIRESVMRLIELMESMLSAARMESGSIELSLSDCEIASLILESCESQRQIAPEHEIVAELQGLPPTIRGDPKLLSQIFSNLLSNAVKYSPGGGRVEVEGRATEHRVSISIRDHGLGIPQGEIDKLFDRFFRASTSVGIPGTGIGLNLAQMLVELHGGKIEVASHVGEGSTFTVTLPAGPGQTALKIGGGSLQAAPGTRGAAA